MRTLDGRACEHSNTKKTRLGAGRRAPTPAMLWPLRRRCDREHPERTPAAIDELERRGDHHRARRRQLVEIAETRQAELAVAVHRRMVRERRLEGARLPGVGADGLDAHA